jgi:acyl dehydratase
MTTSGLPEPLTEQQIAELPMYEWDLAQVGDSAPPFSLEVTPELIARYCEAVRNDNPLYLDPAAATRGPFGGLVGPPTFAFMCAPLRRNEVMHAKGYASPEEKLDRSTPYAKSEILFQRPIRPGDQITSVVELAEKYVRRNNQFITWRTRAWDASDAPVAEFTYTIIWRLAPRDPNALPSTGSGSAASPLEAPLANRLPSLTKHESQEAIDRYSELTRVRPRSGGNLHTMPDFARRTIFGGTVNVGITTAAYCSELLERALGPETLLRPGARLEYKGIRPIRAGYVVTLSGRVVERRATGTDCEIAVHNQDGLLCGVASATVIDQP